MKFLVGIILFLNVWLFADTENYYFGETIFQFKAYRNALLGSLKNQRNDDVISMVRYIKERAPDEFAIDNLELIQIYLLVERYDLAVDLLLGEYEKVGRSVKYSFVRDSLLDYLDANMNLTDSNVVKAKLEEMILSSDDEEQKNLCEILLKLTAFYKIENKFEVMHYSTWSHEKQDFVYKLADKYLGDSVTFVSFGQSTIFHNRVYSKFYYRSGMDPECLRKVILSLEEFEQKFPNSERLPLIKSIRNRFEETLKDYLEFLNYYKRKIYTGGIGVEGWVTIEGWELGIPIQIWRLLFVPTLDSDESYVAGWVFIFGFDLFELKRLKIVPFVGLWDPYVAGMQIEFRPWLEKYTDPELGAAAYLSLKAKYMLKYGELAETGKKDIAHTFYVGLGFHFW
ncbi:MAG: hypothetical protein IKN70_00110 [Fibrobacter sp.]|nr:hypothetical protein [Fibrobacter sp.]